MYGNVACFSGGIRPLGPLRQFHAFDFQNLKFLCRLGTIVSSPIVNNKNTQNEQFIVLN